MSGKLGSGRVVLSGNKANNNDAVPSSAPSTAVVVVEKSTTTTKHIVKTTVEVVGNTAVMVGKGVGFLTQNGELKHSTPLAPASDVAELEYVSALHQCANPQALRQDGAISADEVAAFLKSRHGLAIPISTIAQVVLKGFNTNFQQTPPRSIIPQETPQTSTSHRYHHTTTVKDPHNKMNQSEEHVIQNDAQELDENKKDEEAVLDLVELTAILLIPSLLRLRTRFKSQSDTKDLPPSSVRKDETTEVKHTSNTPLVTEDEPSSVRKDETTEGNHTSNISPVTEDEDDNRMPSVGMFKDVLSLILMDVTGSVEPKCLDAALVKDILRGYGEMALAQDETLVNEMVSVAQRGSSIATTHNCDETHLLDTNAFIEALTFDVVRKYDPAREDRISSNFQDVWSFPSCHVSSNSNNEQTFVDEENANSLPQSTAPLLREETFRDVLKESASKCASCVKTKNANSDTVVAQEDGYIAHDSTTTTTTTRRLVTAQAIDYTADTYRTKSFCVLLWLSFVLFYVSYLFYGQQGAYVHQCRGDENDKFYQIGCPLITGIVNPLLVIAELVIFGTPYIVLASVGNGIEARETIWQMIVGIVGFGCILVVPFASTIQISYWISTEANGNVLPTISLVLGVLVMLVQLCHLIIIFLRERGLCKKWCTWYFSLGNVRYESKIKRAGMFKTDQMLTNAHNLHRDSNGNVVGSESSGHTRLLSRFGDALVAYSKLEGYNTIIGGFRYTWRGIWDGSLFFEEGIWLSNRIILGTVFQIGVTIATPWLAYFGVVFIIDRIETLDVPTQSPVSTPFSAGSFNPTAAPTELDTGVALRIKSALIFGSVFAFITAAFMTSVFIPTMVSTTLKFRRGVIPSLRSEAFLRYRRALDEVANLFGGMLWGVLISSVMIAAIVGGFIYLLLWPTTSRYMFSLIGNYMGLLIVVITRVIAVKCLRSAYFAAFYRKKPLSGNIMTIIMECYSVAISVWFMVVRGIKILIIGALYIGRIDTPLFAPGVGILGPIEIDNWPSVSRKEILVHEAHRHPYIEMLGFLYMMQLRYGSGFATRACSTWRLLFVSALMPWLHRFREVSRPTDVCRPEDEGEQSLQPDDLMFMLSSEEDRVGLGEGRRPPLLRAAGGIHTGSKESMLSERFMKYNPEQSDDSEDRLVGLREGMRPTALHQMSGFSSKRSMMLPPRFSSQSFDKTTSKEPSSLVDNADIRITAIKKEMFRLQNELEELQKQEGAKKGTETNDVTPAKSLISGSFSHS